MTPEERYCLQTGTEYRGNGHFIPEEAIDYYILSLLKTGQFANKILKGNKGKGFLETVATDMEKALEIQFTKALDKELERLFSQFK